MKIESHKVLAIIAHQPSIPGHCRSPQPFPAQLTKFSHMCETPSVILFDPLPPLRNSTHKVLKPQDISSIVAPANLRGSNVEKNIGDQQFVTLFQPPS